MTVNILSTSLRTSLSLSAADRRWIDYLTQTIQDTWDPNNPSRPLSMGYAGSEEFIRLQFEEYLLAFLSSVSLRNHYATTRQSNSQLEKSESNMVEEDPSSEFNADFVDAWQRTANYALFERLTSGSALFDIVEPKHPTAGGLSVEDVQRRVAQQIAELHLDERVREGRETVGRHLAVGKERIGHFSNKLWADIEAMREAQRKRTIEKDDRPVNVKDTNVTATSQHDRTGSDSESRSLSGLSKYAQWSNQAHAPDLSKLQANAKDASAKAGTYLSSWSSWAKDKSRGWQERRASSDTAQSPAIPSPGTTDTVKTAKGALPSEATTLPCHSPLGDDSDATGGEFSAEVHRRWEDVLGPSGNQDDDGKSMTSKTTGEDSAGIGFSPLPTPGQAAWRSASPMSSTLTSPTTTSRTTEATGMKTDDGPATASLDPTSVKMDADDERALYNTAWTEKSPR